MDNLNTTSFYLVNHLAGRTPALDFAIRFFADYLPYALVLLFILWLLSGAISQEQRRAALIAAVSAGAVARGFFVEAVRFFYRHLRPFAALPNVHQLIAESGYSFPSGHATFFFALAAVAYSKNRRVGAFFYVSSALMGVARVAAGVHYPFDIVGGAIIGTLVGFLSVFIVDNFLLKNVV